MDESAFISEALERTGATLLLDLSNVHANARNLGLEPEEAIEMGDPHAEEVLACFVREVAASAFCLVGDTPCAFTIMGRDLEMRIVEPQVGLRSYGGGIARGWPAIRSEVPLFAGKRRGSRFVRDRAPQRGSVALALRDRFGVFDDLKLPEGSRLLVTLQEPCIED